MKLLIVLSTLGALLALTESRAVTRCRDVVSVNGVNHKKEVLKNNVPSPYQLAIDYDTNTLFFSYTANEDEVFKVVYVNLKDKTSGTIRGVPGGFANAVDNKKNLVYIGGRDGIYKYNYDNKEATKLDITDKNIWQMFYKDGLYFTSYPDEKAYLYKDGTVKRVPELEGKNAMLAAVDNDGVIYYSHDGSLYKIEAGKDTKLGDHSLNAFNTDINGNLYFSTSEGIYRIKNGNIESVAEISDLYGFAFESDNSIIYGDQNNIVRLVPTNDVCFTDSPNSLDD